ncbi:MAG: SMC-Scp complex subunit ScpB [Bacteroidetes bacterium]|nr:SMC-Scp complex subunit ScpB [Bacteroidota bacterium]
MKATIPLFLSLTRSAQRSIIEALIFAANPDEILTNKNIFSIVLSDADLSTIKRKKNKENNDEIESSIISDDIYSDKLLNTAPNKETIAALEAVAAEYNFYISDIEKIVEEINEELSKTNRPYKIINYAGGYQFITLPQYGELVHKMLKLKSVKRFSNAQLETLAIIAYKQPVTRQEIDKIRGVMSSGEVINALIDKQLIVTAGHKDILGKPLLYATTDNFLKAFGLNSLKDLPKLKELEEIVEQKLQTDTDVNPISLKISQDDINKLNDTSSNIGVINNNDPIEKEEE